MVDTIDVRDTITNPVDNTDLLILCCQLKICDIGTQDGNDALLTDGCQLLACQRLIDMLLQLVDTSLFAPVVLFVSNTDDESTLDGCIFLANDLDIRIVVFLRKEQPDPFHLLRCRWCHICEFCLCLHLLRCLRQLHVCLLDLI